jgi:photosystem II stability/assembly factor-like uncharacterized protein
MHRLSAVAVLMLSSLAAEAQTWLPAGGPPGGDVRALAADPRHPNRLYLGSADGYVYRSEDAGRRWERTVPGFPLRGMSLDDLVIGPEGELWVGYWEVAGSGGGVARSTDGGRTFAVLAGMAGQSVRALALAPSSPDVLVAGTLAGVFRSDDAGATWRRISPEGQAELRNVESVALDPADPEVIYAGTWHLAWKSSDGGRSWHAIHAGMIADSDVFTLTLDRRTARTLYATACSGIYRSRDAGGLWSKLKGIPTSSRRTRALAQDPEHAETLYAGTTEGLWLSEDDGASWRVVTRQDLVINAIVPLPGGSVLLGTDGAGVLRSGDRGLNWEASNDGFAERFVGRLVFDSANRRVLAAIASDRFHGGVLSAPRPGGPWVSLGSGLEGREVLSIGATGQEVLAGTDDGVFLSVSHCGSWRRLPTVVGDTDAHPRVVDVAAAGENVVLAATSDGLLRSSDGGASWQRLVLGTARVVSALAVSPRDPRVAVAATALGLFRSQDSGAHWAQLAEGFSDGPIHGLTMLPGDDRVLFATTPRGLYKSRDQGATWYQRGGGLPQSDVRGLALHPDGRTVLASDFALGGLYRSDDAGETWRRFPTDGLLSEHVWAVAFDPAAPAQLVAATASGGLHVLSAGPGAHTTAAP